MNFTHHESETKGFFEYKKDEVLMGEISYSKVGSNLIIIDHTFVDPSLRGTGTGRALVKEVIDFAKKNDLKVIPLCPFANSIIKREPEFQSVLSA
ncbi:N-acetyltransferase [bacterium]|nr:MAG: N-acetyltransferase [bacterium]